MQVALGDLMPRWLAQGEGVAFRCPCDHDHELFAWFKNPIAGPLEEEREYHREGTEFGALGFWPPIEHGDCLIVVWKGQVNILYL